MMLALLALLVGSAHAKKPPVIFKKGMIITCPVSQKPQYKFVRTYREGQPFAANLVVDLDTGKHPPVGKPLKCESFVGGWMGTCVSSTKGWLPKRCQDVIKLNPSFSPVASEYLP